MRADLLERYRALPLPDTTDEHWRFTDLRGFDPEAFGTDGLAPAAPAESMLDLDAAGLVSVTPSMLEIERVPEGVTLEPLLDDHPRVGELVGVTDKLTAHNAAMWPNGLLARVPRGVELEKPIYVRILNSDGGALFWRLVVEAEEGARFSFIEEYSSSSPEAPGYTNAAVELFVGQAAKLEYVSIQNLSRETWHFA